MNEDFENYNIEDEEIGEGEQKLRPLTMWTILPVIMTMPAAGWKKLTLQGPSPELATIRFFLPLCILSGASVFFSLFYPGIGLSAEENPFTILLVNAVIQFCSFFIGYYMALVMAKVFLPKEDRWISSSSYGKLLIMTGVATLAIFHILFEAFPMLDFILVFLPLWTIFIQFRGLEHTEFRSDKRILAIAVICLVTITGPTLIEWLLALFT